MWTHSNEHKDHSFDRQEYTRCHILHGKFPVGRFGFEHIEFHSKLTQEDTGYKVQEKLDKIQNYKCKRLR